MVSDFRRKKTRKISNTPSLQLERPNSRVSQTKWKHFNISLSFLSLWIIFRECKNLFLVKKIHSMEGSSYIRIKMETTLHMPLNLILVALYYFPQHYIDSIKMYKVFVFLLCHAKRIIICLYKTIF